MGFNFEQSTATVESLDNETLKHLANHQKLGDSIIELMLELKLLNKNYKDLPSNERTVKTIVKNIYGDEMIINVVGINSTSIISTEMKGNLSFTFIRDLQEIQKIERKNLPLKHLTLIK